MTIKNVQLSGKDLVKKLTEVPFKKKDARTGHPTTYADDLKLIHQLQVLRLEMELQHEHLYKTPVSLDEINKKQTQLFEFAPNGYFALTAEGMIREVNITGAGILGIEKEHLVHQLFYNYIIPEDREIFRICMFNLVETNDYQVLKITVFRNDGNRAYVRIALSGTWIENEFYVLLAMTDITMWKLVESTQAFLSDCNWWAADKDFFQCLTDYLADSLEMNYVSVDRILNEQAETEVISVYHEKGIQPITGCPIAEASYAKLIGQKSFCFPNGVHYLFPHDSIFKQLNAESYAGVTLWSSKGDAIGMITIIGQKPLIDSKLAEMVLKQVSIRAAAELEHRQLEETISELRTKLELQVQEGTAELQAINEQLRNEIQFRQEKEESLKVAEEKYRTIADFTYNWETWLSPSGEFIYVSPSCKRITGYSVEEFMQDPTLAIRIIHPDDRPIAEEQFSKAFKGVITSSTFEYRIITRDGFERWLGHHFQPVFDSRGVFMGQRGSSHDITQRKVAEKILLDSQKHLRQLSQRMEAITEAERTRIAREIHDELGHLLTALKYDMEAIVNQSDMSADSIKGELAVMIDMVDSLIDSVRKIATELRPGILDQLGLFPAIEWQIKQFRLRTKICCVFSMEPMEVTFDKNETNIIFRILQEILTNITRHAKATHIKVLLTKNDSDFMMEVTDNGIGFEYDDIPQSHTLGLTGMKERALSIGGEIQIDSKPGKGTLVRLLLPKN